MLYRPDFELIRERVLKLQDHRLEQGRPVSQNDIALAIGMSAASVSHFLNHKEQGDLPKIAALLDNFVKREELKDEGGLLKIPFAETQQARQLMGAYQFALQFNRLVVVLGSSGFGKTRTVLELQRRDRSLIVVTAWSQLGASGILQELCEAIKVSDKGRLRALMKRLKARLTGSGRVIIVDDAHTLTFKALDVLRYVYDQTGVGMLLVGIQALGHHLIATNEETEQLASRVSGRIWKMPDIEAEDLRLILAGTMDERHLEQAMGLLGRDEQLMCSPRRMGNVLEVAGTFAARAKSPITLDHIAKAMKAA
ncbi:MAG: AAA family ATPase [Candidatus Rokuibacteriota bacterium]